MPTSTALAVCPNCSCHAKLIDARCPCCGESIRAESAWKLPAAIVAMGLTAAACGSSVVSGNTSGAGGGTSSSTEGDGGNGGNGGAPTTSQSTWTQSAGYTVAYASSTVSSFTGAGGAGGDGGAGGAGGNGGAGGAGGK